MGDAIYMENGPRCFIFRTDLFSFDSNQTTTWMPINSPIEEIANFMQYLFGSKLTGNGKYPSQIITTRRWYPKRCWLANPLNERAEKAFRNRLDGADVGRWSAKLGNCMNSHSSEQRIKCTREINSLEVNWRSLKLCIRSDETKPRIRKHLFGFHLNEPRRVFAARRATLSNWFRTLQLHS